jgi:hypothetical protein
MRKACLSLLAALCVTVCIFTQGTAPGFAKEGAKKAGAEKKEARIQGVVVRSNDKTSTLTVRTDKEGVERMVHFDSATRWTQSVKGEVKDVERSVVKDGDRVICLGNYNDKKEFIATRVSKREPGSGVFHSH